METMGHWLTIHRSDYTAACKIMKMFNKRENFCLVHTFVNEADGRIQFGIRCSWADWIDLKHWFVMGGIIFQ